MLARGEPDRLSAPASAARWERRALRGFVDAFLRDAARVRRAELGGGPWASLAQGAAGLAFALGRCGAALDRPALLERGRELAATARRARSGFAPYPASVAFAAPGAELTAALLGDPAAARRLAAHIRAARRAPLELYLGRAGLLGAAALLARNADLRAAGDALFDDLARGARRPTAQLGALAHGRPGSWLALLEWARVTGRPVPPWLVRALHGARGVTGERSGRLCGGSSGWALLWVKAFEQTGDGAFLDAAHRAVADALAGPAPGPSLCCGLAGVAYACLALARHDPTLAGTALRVTLHALSSPRVTDSWGLLAGEAGLLCLAVDVLAGGRVRVPFFEA